MSKASFTPTTLLPSVPPSVPPSLTAADGPSEGWLCPSQKVGRQLMSKASFTPASPAQLTAALRKEGGREGRKEW